MLKKYLALSLTDLKTLLSSPLHEERFIALVILVEQFRKADEKKKKEIFDLYLNSTKYINNWDLVDISAPKIVGKYLEDKDRSILYKLAISKNIWETRIAILSTLYFIIEQKQYSDTFKIADLMLTDNHDLIHKAAGWMLREVGKRVSKEALIEYLKARYRKMPRTMLRYSIEHFPEKVRMAYIEGRV